MNLALRTQVEESQFLSNVHVNYDALTRYKHSHPMTSHVDLIVFDFDGTLADSATWFAGVFNEVAQRFEFPTLTRDELHRLRNLSNREIVRRLRIPMWKMPFIARYMRRRVAAEADAIALFAGVGSLLHRLHDAQKTLAIVSSNSEANIRRILGAENAKTISHFSCGAGLFGKARLLRKVMKRSGARPFTTVCIGDETRDIEAARRVGAIAAAVTWGYASTAILREFNPDVLFESIEDIADYVLVERMAC
jgi:phosphoglycolate phosphatase